MRLTVLLAVLVLFVFATAAPAEIFRYTDKNGELHFVDELSRVPKKYRNQLKTARPLRDISVVDATRPAARRQKVGAPPAQRNRSYGRANVEVYMTSWCGYCRKLERFLKEKGISYTAYDIEKDSNAARIFSELGGGGVPVTRVGSHVVHGYNPEAVISYLNRGN